MVPLPSSTSLSFWSLRRVVSVACRLAWCMLQIQHVPQLTLAEVYTRQNVADALESATSSQGDGGFDDDGTAAGGSDSINGKYGNNRKDEPSEIFAGQRRQPHQHNVRTYRGLQHNVRMIMGIGEDADTENEESTSEVDDVDGDAQYVSRSIPQSIVQPMPGRLPEPVRQREAKSMAGVIKTTLVSNRKYGTGFDELHPTGGIKRILARTGKHINGLQLVYMPNVEGMYHGRSSPDSSFVLDDDEEIVHIVCKEHEKNYGMEYIKLTTDKGNFINITTGGSGGGDGAIAEFEAPAGYILSGIHGILGGTYEGSLVSVGFYWRLKPTPTPSSSPTTSSPTKSSSLSPSAMPSISSIPSVSTMPTFIDVVDSTTLERKIMAGYQGWFMTPGDGTGRGWKHWSSKGALPNSDSVSIEMWPDLREFDADELVPTNFSYSDGRKAGLFSSHNPKTVHRHVRWMHQYGIDGVFVQRFLSEAIRRTASRDQVLDNIRTGSEAFGRVFANMYDVSKIPSLKEQLVNDWKHLVDDLNITSSPRYLHHKGRPVLAMWGFDVSTRNHNVSEVHEIIDWFTRDADDKYLVTLVGGSMSKWREKVEWQDVYERFDVISPWSVGRLNTLSRVDKFHDAYIVPDMNHTNAAGMDYMPVVFPGYSRYNKNQRKSKFNLIPRLGGRFLWNQLHNAMSAGVNMIYVAMFDEVDEGTAIFKTVENAQHNPTTGKFLTLDEDGDEVPSDWYLRLVGEATRLFRAGLVDENLPFRG